VAVFYWGEKCLTGMKSVLHLFHRGGKKNKNGWRQKS